MLPKNSNTLSANKVFVGLSGGVDSAVSAALLKERGFDVTGVFIKVWQPDFLPCTWREEQRDAMRVAIALDIPFLFFNFEEEYKKGVVDAMLSEYKIGRTPNPDVLCNKEVKFGAFWKKAREMGADYIATGHYANITRKTTEVFSTENLPDSRADALRDAFPMQYLLREGIDKEKDQSYFLWTLTQDDLSHIFFPVGSLEKNEVRKLARKFKLPVSEKKDSQGICFIGNVSMEEFLSHFISTKTGDVLNTEGEIIGSQHGAIFYTIGERHHFDVYKKKPEDGPFYVVSKDIKTNTIMVSNKELEISSLSPIKITVKNINWITRPRELSFSARIRYRGEKLSVSVQSRAFDSMTVEFDKPVRGLSLGQSIVFYSEEVCLGGGVMDKVLEI